LTSTRPAAVDAPGQRPRRALAAEAAFDDVALARLVKRLGEFYAIGPELVYSFRISLAAEGQPPD
jgi:hypothetical protein